MSAQSPPRLTPEQDLERERAARAVRTQSDFDGAGASLPDGRSFETELESDCWRVMATQ
jgi:hypothetical protein